MDRATCGPIGTTTAELLDRVQMHAADRAAAKATLRRAEAIAEAAYRMTEAVQGAVEFAARATRVLAQRVRAKLA